MQAQDIVRVFGYSTAAIVLISGIVIILGIGFPRYIPNNYRVILGIVLVLYGVYRAATLWGKQRNERREE